MATLKVLKGTNVGQSYDLPEGEAVIGRYPFCDIVLPSQTISRQHARITYFKGRYFVEDLGSLNGTFLNGDRVRKRTPLDDQDRIRIYETLLLFFEQEPAEAQLAEDQPSDSAGTETQPFVPSNPTPPNIPAREEPAVPELRELAVVRVLDLNSGAPATVETREKLRSVLERTKQVAGRTSIDEILGAYSQALLDVLPQAERAHGLLEDPAGGGLIPKASRHRKDDTITSTTLGPLNQKLAKQVMSRGEAVLAANDGEDDEDSVLAGEARTMLCAPLLGPSRRPLGILHLEAENASVNQFSEDDLHLLVSVGSLAGQAVECALLFGDQMSSPPEGSVRHTDVS